MLPAHEDTALPENDFELLMPDSVNQCFQRNALEYDPRHDSSCHTTRVAGSFLVLYHSSGEDTERKLINFLIIVGSAVLGVAATLVIEYLIHSPDELAMSIGIISANIGCAIAGAWNYWRSGGIYNGKKSRGNKSYRTVV